MEDKSYLDDLMNYINENQKKRSEESLSLIDTPQMGMPLTRQIKAENPNIPESDVTDYKSGVKNDLMDYMAGVGMSSPNLMSEGIKKIGTSSIGTKIGAGIENGISKLDPNGRFKEIIDGFSNKYMPEVRDLYKSKRNIGLANNTEKTIKDLAEKNLPVPELPVPKVEKDVANSNFKDWLVGRNENTKALEEIAKKEKLSKILEQEQAEIRNKALEKIKQDKSNPELDPERTKTFSGLFGT